METLLRCGHDALRVAALADGELTTAERQAVEAILLDCACCRDYWDSLSELNRLMVGTIPMVAPAGFATRVNAEIGRVERRKLPLQLLVAFAAMRPREPKAEVT